MGEIPHPEEFIGNIEYIEYRTYRKSRAVSASFFKKASRVGIGRNSEQRRCLLMFLHSFVNLIDTHLRAE